MSEETAVVQTFNHENFGQFRFIKTDGDEIWFAVVDVCRTLGLKNPSMAVTRLKKNEKAKFNLGYSGKRGNPYIWFANEPGLYRLIFMSKKPEAEKFQDLVYHDVLPSIRKFGYYVAPNKPSETEDEPFHVPTLEESYAAQKYFAGGIDFLDEQVEKGIIKDWDFDVTDVTLETDSDGVTHPVYHIGLVIIRD